MKSYWKTRAIWEKLASMLGYFYRQFLQLLWRRIFANISSSRMYLLTKVPRYKYDPCDMNMVNTTGIFRPNGGRINGYFACYIFPDAFNKHFICQCDTIHRSQTLLCSRTYKDNCGMCMARRRRVNKYVKKKPVWLTLVFFSKWPEKKYAQLTTDDEYWKHGAKRVHPQQQCQ
jgi:hypothetical protein